jgi:hypothetical protein
MSSISRFDEQTTLRVLRPYLGFVKQRYRRKPITWNNVTMQPFILEPLPPEEQPKKGEFTTNSVCPLVYSGWPKSPESKSRFMYANPALVLAQQFWNGMQVFLLFLMIVVNYYVSSVAPEYHAVDSVGINQAIVDIIGATTTKGRPGGPGTTHSIFFTSWRILPLLLLPGTMYLVNHDGYLPCL